MRRSSIFLLLGALLLGVLAVLGARTMMGSGKKVQVAEAPQTYVVVAAKPMKFGDKIGNNFVKLQPWPGAAPAGAYTKIQDVVGDGERTVLRDVKEGEMLLATAITGGAGRLASSTLLGPDMRAISLPVGESSGAGGFLAPGDRVDVFLTRTYEEDVAYAGAIVQGARVLAVGQTADTSKAEPEVVKSVTIEVTPAEAQKVALAQQVGTVHLALRATGDESRVPITTASAVELFGMRAPRKGGEAAPAASAVRKASSSGGYDVRVVRGTETTHYQVSR